MIEKIRFDDGSVLNEAAIRRRLNLSPPPSAQVPGLQHHSLTSGPAMPGMATPEVLAADTSMSLLMLSAALFSRLNG